MGLRGDPPIVPDDPGFFGGGSYVQPGGRTPPPSIDRRDLPTVPGKPGISLIGEIFDLLTTRRQFGQLRIFKEKAVAAEQQAKQLATQNAARVRIREVCCC